MSQLLGVFDHPHDVAGAARKLRDRGYTDLEVFAPAPFEEVELAMDPKPSAVRGYTLVGGLTGVVTGYAMTLWMANNWKIMLGGKPFSSIPPYTIIGFELTILFGGIMTLIGLLVVAKLPSFRRHKAYSARFSAEEFGLVVSCKERDVSEIDGLLREHHAKEVSLVEA